MPRPDPHSYADPSQARTDWLELDLKVDFQSRTLKGDARLLFTAPAQGPFDLDTRDLTIEAVESLDGRALQHQLHPADPVLGSRLTVQLPAGSKGVRIRYATSPTASALQWLEPAQTAGGKLPYLFSQCQAIHARSVAPLQDSPSVRIRYRASLTVPKALRGLMAAAHVSRQEQGETAVEKWEMPQAIPPYLFAFAVGDLVSRPLDARMAVWSEPSVVDQAAWEFESIPQMMHAAESLFGPYDWDRYDVLVMPPSFPYGGMENPRLTFATPSLLAGDRSLVNVIAHELAHAWTGNLVTNASANDFWLNEGFTVYAERRIVEQLQGRARSELQAAIGSHDLQEALERFKDRPELTKLRTNLEGVDPDEAYSTVPYEKGYLFLRKLEELAGREKWDKFLKTWLHAYRFQSATTQQFLDVLERELPGLAAKANAKAWIDGPGLPADAPQPRSERLEAVQAMARAVTVPPPSEKLDATELQLYLAALPALTAEQATKVQERFGLRRAKSLELRCAFVEKAIGAGLPDAVEQAREVVSACGRMKFLRPIFKALNANAQTRPAARKIFDELKPRYHPIAQAVIEGMLSSGKP